MKQDEFAAKFRERFAVEVRSVPHDEVYFRMIHELIYVAANVIGGLVEEATEPDAMMASDVDPDSLPPAEPGDIVKVSDITGFPEDDQENNT